MTCSSCFQTSDCQPDRSCNSTLLRCEVKEIDSCLLPSGVIYLIFFYTTFYFWLRSQCGAFINCFKPEMGCNDSHFLLLVLKTQKPSWRHNSVGPKVNVPPRIRNRSSCSFFVFTLPLYLLCVNQVSGC